MLMFMEDYIYSETKIVLCIENVEFKLTGNVAKNKVGNYLIQKIKIQKKSYYLIIKKMKNYH